MPTYTSQYPSAHNDTYVKSTTKFDANYWAYFATDPALSLIGNWNNVTWISADGDDVDQRFHIDLGSAKAIRRIYYENGHHVGGTTAVGAKNFTFWGSNTGAGTFDDLVYGNDEGWVQIPPENLSQTYLKNLTRVQLPVSFLYFSINSSFDSL